MLRRILFRSTVLLLIGMWLAGCIPYTSQRDDPRFAGYHRAGSSQGVTASITDREALIPTAAPDQQLPPNQLEAEKVPADRDYTYQDWYRNRYRNNDAFQLNLSYHLYGPYYYRDLRSRYWLNYQQRWHRLPWYAGQSWYNDPRWDYPYWHDSWYDPWYGYYDPWYGYYDPWYSYYDPWYSGRSYGYYGGYYGWHPWYGYGTTTTGPVQAKATERRSRGRRDLPTGLAPGSDSDMSAIPLRTADPLAGLGPESGISTTKTAASQFGRSKSRGTSTRSTRWGRRKDSGSSGSSGKQARSSSRQGSYTSSSSSSSSSSGSSATRSSSSSGSSTKSSSSSTKSARPSSRKP